MKKQKNSNKEYYTHFGLWMCSVVVVGLLFAYSGMLEDIRSFLLGESTVFEGPGTGAGLREVQEQLRGTDSGISTSDSIIAVILGWVDFALPFAGLFAFVALVYAGFLYVTALGDESQTEKAKNIVLWVAIGIVLIFSAYAITSTLIGASSQ